MAEPHKSDDIDSWDVVKTPPTPLFEGATMTELFVYLVEVEGHRAIDPDATNSYGYGAGPNTFCGTNRMYRGACPSCVALRLYRHGPVKEE